MNIEHIQNMEYSLRDVEHLLGLIKAEGLTWPIIIYKSDYDFFNYVDYSETVNKQLLTQSDNELLKRKLRKHLNIAKSIVSENIDTDKTNNIGQTRLYCDFSKSPHNNLIVHHIDRNNVCSTYEHTQTGWKLLHQDAGGTEVVDKYIDRDYQSTTLIEKLFCKDRALTEEIKFLLDEVSKETGNTQPTDIKNIIPEIVWNDLEAEGLITINPLTWKKTKALLAYFVEVANDKFNLKHGEKRQIRPFEIMFNKTGITSTINDYKKTGDLPVGHEIVDKILK